MESILVLEDDDTFRELVADTLSDHDYEVTQAASAEEAIACAQKQPFHLILSDVRMAGPLDGVGAIERIKTLRPHIRSIVLTGFTDQDAPLRAAKIQADDYLFKPVETSQLLAVVRLTLDRESDILSPLAQFLQTPGALAQKALSWLYDGQLQQLGQLRERCFQRLFVLLRSNRLSAEDAYPVYLHLLEVESGYHQAKPGDWSKLLTSYTTVESRILAAAAQETLSRPDNPALAWPKFQRLCQVLKQGEISAEQFQQSVLLFLDPAFRRANLANYLAYHKLWATAEASSSQVTDPLLGRTFEGYTLRKLLPEYKEVRVYSATNESGLKRQVMALPAGASQDFVQTSIQTGKAVSLGAHGDFDLFLLQQQSHPLRHQLPPGGLRPIEAWKLLKPIFLQVQAYHERGQCSGSISIDDIEMIPGQPATLNRFSPDYATSLLQQLQELKARGPLEKQRMNLSWLVPIEIQFAHIEEPIPESDQFMLSYLFTRILRGLETRFALLHFSVSTVNQERLETDPHWSHLRDWPDLRNVLVKMGNHDYTLRYRTLKDAIEAIDAAFAPRTLSSLIPPEGMPLKKAWPLLRPIFLQVQEYHRQGLCSGCFTISDIEVLADGQPRLIRFDAEASLAQIQAARGLQCQEIAKTFKFPCEVRFGQVSEPLPASDQPLLGLIFAQMLAGLDPRKWNMFLVHDLSESQWIESYAPLFGKATHCLSKLTRPQPEERFSHISDAIIAIEQALLTDR